MEGAPEGLTFRVRKSGEGGDEREPMARLAGGYRHRDERTVRGHPRNRR